RHHVYPQIRVVVRPVLSHAGGDDLHLSAGAGQRYPWRHARDDREHVLIAVRLELRPKASRRPRVDRTPGIREVARHHANHGAWRAIERDRASYGAGIRPEPSPPGVVAEDHDRRRVV